MNTQTAVQDALKAIPQAAMPATKTLEQELAETRAKLAAALAPKAIQPLRSVNLDTNFGPIEPKPEIPKVDLLLNQQAFGEDNLHRPIIIGQSATITEKNGKPCKPYNLGIGVRYNHPQTGEIVTTWHKERTWKNVATFRLAVTLAELVSEAIALELVTDPK